ncbi:hypothetical protein OAX78_02095 [Planctomycetota bacterium]|nr:hypothetical protein [Planctomycetota bacterium]
MSAVWKGVVDRETVLNPGLGNCQFYFQPDTVYVVYARRAPAGGLITDMCTRTEVSKKSEREALGESYAPRAPREPPRHEVEWATTAVWGLLALALVVGILVRAGRGGGPHGVATSAD